MESRDKKSVLEALGEVAGKSMLKPRRTPQDCGDIGLKIARDGTWYYQNSPIGRRPLVKLFASVLRRERDGRYYLVTPAEKALVHVEDTPFLAVAMEAKGSGRRQRLTFRTNLDEMARAGPEHPLSFALTKSGGFTPYILVRDALKARLTRPVYYDLIAAAVTESEGGSKELGVWSGGEFFAFPAAPSPGKH